MKKFLILILLLLIIVAFSGFFYCCRPVKLEDKYESIASLFKQPPASFRTAPLWVWNDRVTRDKIREQLQDFKDRGIGGVFVHPRPGLITPYLTEEWFSLFSFAVAEARSLGLEIWIYDENSYPSGFAGGHVPAALPDAVRSGLHLLRLEELPTRFDNPVVAVFLRTPTGFQDVTERFNKGDQTLKGTNEYYIFEIIRSRPSPWYGGFTYVDLMRNEVTEKFLDVTLNAYKNVAGADFGKAVPGVFQDEAEIGPAGGEDTVNYTPEIFAAFQKKWGYDLRAHLISLFEPYGEWRRVRHNYYSTLLDLFIENWAKPYYSYCTDNNLIFTGHYWEHEWPVPRISPDNLAMYAYAHMPGIDILMNQWSKDVHAQFGNARSVREVRSAANQLGRKRTLSETYGASGWDLTFLDQKRIGDWEYALGINFLNQHLSFMTIKGARKRDHPLSFSYHESWWKHYNFLVDYFARLSVAMSAGEQINRILVLEPTTTGWMYYSPSGKNIKLAEVAQDFQKFINLLEENHIEYDLASEKTIQELARITYRKLILGKRSYDLIVMPPGFENINDSTVSTLREYLFRGGQVLSWVSPPDFINGIITRDMRDLQRSYGDRWLDSGPDGFEKLRRHMSREISFSEPETNAWVFHQRRRFSGGQLVLLVNTSLVEQASGNLNIVGEFVEKWNPLSGEITPYPFDRDQDMVKLHYSLEPAGSLLLCVLDRKPKTAASIQPPLEKIEIISAVDKCLIERKNDNVLTLDYCDLILDGKNYPDLYFYEAQKKTFQRYGFDKNPWDSSVQFLTSILDRNKFPSDSGFEAVFWFQAAKKDYADFRDLKVVVERPSVFEVFINGREIKAVPDSWWLDKDFGVYEIGPHVITGRNRIAVRARPFSIEAELEPVYLVGDFSLKPANKGFILVPTEEISLGAWKSQGMPFYGHTVSYTKKFKIDSGLQQNNEKFFVRLNQWRGSVAEVLIDGVSAGLIAFPPYELEVTPFIKSDAVKVSVIVYGTLRNTLGPFHGRPPQGSAWPAMFQRGADKGCPPGIEYSLVDYGLFKDFELVKRMN